MKSTKKQQILMAAATLFRQKGYASTSVRDLARVMGMEAPSLYNHISSKQSILEELLLGVANLFTDGMKKIKQSDQTNLEKLQALIALHVQLTIDHTDEISLIPNEWIHLDAEKSKRFVQLRAAYEKDFKNILQKVIKENGDPSLNVDIALFSILSSLRWLYSWYSKNDTISAQVLKVNMVQALTEGLSIR